MPLMYRRRLGIRRRMTPRFRMLSLRRRRGGLKSRTWRRLRRRGSGRIRRLVRIRSANSSAGKLRRMLGTQAWPPNSVRQVIKNVDEFLLTADSENPAPVVKKHYNDAVKNFFQSGDSFLANRQKAVWDKYLTHGLRAWTIKLQLIGKQTQAYGRKGAGTEAEILPVSVDASFVPQIWVWDYNKNYKGPTESMSASTGYHRRLASMRRPLKFSGKVAGKAWINSDFTAMQSSDRTVSDVAMGIGNGDTEQGASTMRLVNRVIGRRGQYKTTDTDKVTNPGLQIQLQKPPQPSTELGSGMQILYKWSFHLRATLYSVWEHQNPVNG